MATRKFTKQTKVVLLLPVAIVAATLILYSLNAKPNVRVSANQDPTPVQLISDYRAWHKVNQKPELMSSTLSELCIAPPPPHMVRLDKLEPHKDKFINVFVNEAGYNEFISKKNPLFSVNTVIVKEKLPSATKSIPELLTVMVKREAGFDPKNGDWEYFAFNGQGTQVTSGGKVQHCQECHEDQKSEDYVFRKYLAGEDWKRMK
jgi:hypothetical protein